MRSDGEYAIILVQIHQINKIGVRERKNSPTCSLPLNTYNLQPKNGFLASGGSLYLRTVLVPSTAFTVLVAAARRPEGAKFGFDLSTAEADLEPERDRERDLTDRECEGREGDAERRE